MPFVAYRLWRAGDDRAVDKVERAEDFLRAEGFREFRVRVHGELARVEIAQGEMEKALNLEAAGRFARCFAGNSVSSTSHSIWKGFRSGAMNEAATRV